MESHDAHETHEAHGESLTTYWLVFIALMVLLVLTVGAYMIDFSQYQLAGHNLGVLNVTIAMIIAIIKALMVILIFMHVRASSKLVWVFSAAAFFWLSIMIIGTLHDYASRPMDAAYSHDFFQNTPAAVAYDHRE